MKTIKKQFKKEDIESTNFCEIIKRHNHIDCVKIALYMAKDCFHLVESNEAKNCIELAEKWIDNSNSVEKEELRAAANRTRQRNKYDRCAIYVAVCIVYPSCKIADTYTCFHNSRNPKKQEYKEYARLFAYEDLDFPYKEQAKTFNLDDTTDLKVFLDFLTDHYPEALIYSRKQFLKDKLPKEYLKMIYQ